MTRRAKKRLAFLAGATVLIGALGTTAHFVRQAQKVKLVAQARQAGLEAHARQDWATALERLNYVVSNNDRDAEVMLAFAEARQRVPQENNGHISFAIRVAGEVLDAEPDNQRAMDLLIDLYKEVGFRTELMSTIQALLALDPTNRKALESAAGLHVFEGRDQEAAQYADMIVEAYRDDYDAHTFRISLLERIGAEEELNDAVETIVARFPNSIGAQMILVRSLVGKGDEEHVKRAIEVAGAARSLGFRTSQDLTDYLDVLDVLTLEDPDLANRADEVLVEQLESSEFGVAAAQVGLARGFRSGALAEADRFIEEITASSGEASSAALGWALVVNAARNGELIDEIAEELARRPDRAAQWWAEIGSFAVDLARRDHTSASGRIDSLATGPEDPELLTYLAATLDAETGEWRRAVQRLGLLVNQPQWRASQWRAARHAIARLLLEHGYPAEAVAALQPERRFDPILMSLALISAGEQNPDDARYLATAMALTQELAEKNPVNPAVLAVRIRACIASDRQPEAIAAAKSLLDLSVPIPEADALDLARRIEPIDEKLARAFADMAGDLAVRAQAVRLRPRDSSAADIAELKRAYLDQVQAAEGSERFQLLLQLADVLVAADDADAVGLMTRISEEYPADARAQLAVLGSESAWRDEALIRAAIGRLRSSAAPTAIGWRVFNTRVEYTFGGDADGLSTMTAELADAIRGRPDDPTALAVLAEAVGRQGDLQAAIAYLARAVRAAPRRAGLLIRLVELQIAAGQIDEADRRLAELEVFASLPEALLLLRASLLADRGRVEAARQDFVAVQELGRWEGSLGLAVLHLRRNEREEARAILEQMAAVPDLPDKALASFATLFAALGNVEDQATAESLLDRMSSTASRGVRLRKAALLMQFGDDAAAEQRFRDAADAGDPMAGIELAGFLLKRDRFDEARKACATAAEITGDAQILAAIEDLRRIVDMCEQFGPGAEQTRILQGALDGLTPSAAVLQLAEALRDASAQTAGDARAALDLARSVREVTDRYNTFFAAWRVLTEAYVLAEEGDRAVDAAITASRLMPNDPRSAGLVVGAFMDLRRWDEALFATVEWRRRLPADQFNVDFAVATIQIQREQYAEAFAAVNRWWPDGQDSDERLTDQHLVIVATILLGLDRVEEAHQITWDPESGEDDWALQYLRLSEIIRDRPQTAREWIARVEPRLTGTPAGRFQVGRYWYELAVRSGDAKDYQEATRVLTPLTSDGPLRGAAFSILGICYDQLERYEDAITAYESALSFLPDQPTLLNNLAYATLRVGGDAQHAVEIATRAIANAGDWGAAEKANLYDTLGSAFLAASRPAEALEEFRRAAQTPNAGISIRVGLGESLAALGQLDDARAEVAEVRRLRTSEPIQDAYIRSRFAALEAFVRN